ncbi:MAG: BadF/BadG/BcrA/BcrD ATPase family protein [Candidatus Helarchaeota archaeon]
MAYYVGLDVGSCYCKCVVIDDQKNNEILSTAITSIEGSPKDASKKVVDAALSTSKIKLKNVSKIVSVGRNRKKVPFNNEEGSEIKCIAKGALKFIPSIRTVVDLGALTNKAIKINSKGRVIDYVVNDKCASGSGIFLELVAKALQKAR